MFSKGPYQSTGTVMVTLKYEKDSFSRKGKGLLLSRKGARGIGSGLIHGSIFINIKYV